MKTSVLVHLYFDSSALVKLVVTVEPESLALRSYLSEAAGDAEFTAAITRTELVRAAARLRDADSPGKPRLLLTRLQFVAISTALLDAASDCRRPNSAPSMRSISPLR